MHDATVMRYSIASKYMLKPLEEDLYRKKGVEHLEERHEERTSRVFERQ
jgi:hypothetical protein